MIHLQFIHLVKSVSDRINVICGNYFCQGHWRKCSNFCIKYINVCQASIKLFLFIKRYHISMTMKVHQVHHLQKHMAYMYFILYECQAFVNNSQKHTQLLYMTFERLVPIKQAKVYVSWPNTLTDLSVSASDLATSSQGKIEEIFRQVSYLNYKSFSSLCGVADWLIISGLNAILPCASSFIKYNIHVCHVVLWIMDLMNFHGQ